LEDEEDFQETEEDLFHGLKDNIFRESYFLGNNKKLPKAVKDSALEELDQLEKDVKDQLAQLESDLTKARKQNKEPVSARNQQLADRLKEIREGAEAELKRWRTEMEKQGWKASGLVGAVGRAFKVPRPEFEPEASSSEAYKQSTKIESKIETWSKEKDKNAKNKK
jgi:hypothetical protein